MPTPLCRSSCPEITCPVCELIYSSGYAAGKADAEREEKSKQ